MWSRARAAGIIIIGIGLGSLRDLLFINLNYQIDHVSRATAVSYAHSAFQAAVHGWGLSALMRLKWILAAFFMLAMWALALLLVRYAGAMQRLARPVSAGFVGIAAIAGLLQLISRWVPTGEAAVNLLHAIQYPVLLLVLQAALIFFPGFRQRPH
jgi:hypothetical protein